MGTLRWAWLAFCLSFVGVVSCGTMSPPACAPEAPTRADAGVPPLPFFSAAIHVDTDFDAVEREHIRNAASAWGLLSAGRATLRTVEDLDFERTEALDPHAHVIVKIDSAADIVGMVDAQHAGFKVLAFTFVPKEPMGRRAVFLIVDRIDPEQFMWVATHELGHFLGMNDLDAPGNVMSGMGRFRGSWFTPEDLRECQSVGACR